jgi:hypothetical protein
MGDLSAWLYSYSVTGNLTEKQKSLMEQTLNYYKISFSRGMLIKKIVDVSDITKSMLAMAQAISRISDVNYVISPKKPSNFNNTFKYFLDNNGFNYETNKFYTGNSGRERKVDFLVKGKNKNSLVCTLSLNNKKDINNKSDSTFSKWSDLLYLKESEKFSEKSSIVFISLIDDSFMSWPQSNVNLLKTVSTVERWTNKMRLTKLLSFTSDTESD